MRRQGLTLLACGGLLACSSSSAPPPVANIDDFMASIKSNPSCALDCSPTCTESQNPWTCPAMAEWGTIPHDPACPAWDGKTTPPALTGTCTASAPSAGALAKANRTMSPIVLPDGRRLAPSGTEWVFSEPDLPGGFAGSAVFDGTHWLIVGDEGYDTNALRVVNTTLLRAGGTASPVVSTVKWSPPKGIGYGLAFEPTTNVVYVAGDLGIGKIIAYDLDPATGSLTEDAAKSIALPASTLSGSLAISPDGKTLLVSQGLGTSVLVYSLDPASYGKAKGSIELGQQDAYAVAFDPNDASGNTAYVTLWTSPVSPSDPTKMQLQQLDVTGGKASTISVGQAPEAIAFLGARYAVIANALTDSLSVVDRPAGKVVLEVPVPTQGQTHGAGPSALAFDAKNNRVYATLSSVNGVAAFDVDVSGSAPKVTLAGVFSTGWWPSSVTVDPADGTLYITNGKGHGSGTDDVARDFDTGAVADLIRGSVQAVPYMDATALAAATTAFDAANQVAMIPGYSTVQCNGAPYDFPIPDKIDSGPSTKITNVFFVVRENKTFDDIFGDVPGVDGDAKLVMAPGKEDTIWPNARAIGAAFAHMDNYYSDAEQSIQGHAWTVFGRTTDYTERRWVDIWGRGEFGIGFTPGVGDFTVPMEGNVFSWLQANDVTMQNMGDLLGLAYRDTQWPGGTSEGTIPDTTGACYIAERTRLLCNAAQFSYVWLANDHTLGFSAGRPAPPLMIAVNDEATGMLLDAISHSPIWPTSLVIVIEDDPNTGSDHVDLHRSISLFASPWVKRHYVSHAHYDVASLHKLFSHVYGKPYRNATIANAALPLDLFTSTPDYTPYTYKPRAYQDLSCNPAGTTGGKAAEQWDFSEPDNQPGLAAQVVEAMKAISR